MPPQTQSVVADSLFSIKKVFLVSLIVSLCISALVAIYVFLFGKFDDTEVRLLATTLAVGGFSLTGLCSAALYDKKSYPGFASVGFLVVIVGFVLTMLLIWGQNESEFLVKMVLIMMVLSFSFAHASLILMAESHSGLVNVLLVATLACIAVVAAMVINIVLGNMNFDIMWGPSSHTNLFYYRLLGVFAVLDVLGTIVTPIVRRFKA